MRRRASILLALSLLLLGGCGGGSGEEKSDSTPPPSEIAPDGEKYYYQQWYINHDEDFYESVGIDPKAGIDADYALSHYCGAGVKIAVIDDGLDMKHEDLAGALKASYDIATGGSDVSHSNPWDYHGTAVSGIIAARINGKGIAGVAGCSELIFLKYRENMSDSETIELFEKAKEFGADIVLCSWGTYDVSEAVRDEIVDLSSNGREGRGMVVVFAAGNDDRYMGNDESAIPEVISVGASDIDNDRAWYSNYGRNLDILAPGGDYDHAITTLDDSGEVGTSTIDPDYLLYDDYYGFVGTSASAAIVAGAVALMLEKNPTLSRERIEDILKKSASKIGHLPYEDGRNDYYGYGKLDLDAAMQMIP